MKTYSIIKIGVHGNRASTGYKSMNYLEARNGLKNILIAHKDDTPWGRKNENYFSNRNAIHVLDGSDEINYKIEQD
jgi:hypothetical protein